MSAARKTTTRRGADGPRAGVPAGNVRRRWRDTPVIIASGQPDPEALRSVIRGWLAPLLVRQFLAERGVRTPQGKNRSEFAKSVYWKPLQEARGRSRVNETA
jgi:hypothetical protein